MAKSTLFAAALLGACATASPLIKKDNDACFNATIRKEYLLQIKTYEPKNPFASEANNVNQVRVNIADPTNQDQNAIVCSDARWNSTQQSFPTEYLSCSDPTLSWKLTSHTDSETLELVVKQTFVQGPFSETVLASYDGTEGTLRGSCTEKGCSAWFMFGEQGHAKVYDVQKTGPPSTPFPERCPPNPLPTVSNWPIRYSSDGPADTSSTVPSQIGFDILTNAQNGYRVKCNGPAWDSATQSAQPADWYPCPEIEYIPGKWSFRIESYTDYKTFNLGIKQNICNEVQCQDNLAYANLTVATQDPDYSSCDGKGKCTASSAFNTVDAPIYAVDDVTRIE